MEVEELIEWIKEYSPSGKVEITLREDDKTLLIVPVPSEDRPIKVVFED